MKARRSKTRALAALATVVTLLSFVGASGAFGQEILPDRVATTVTITPAAALRAQGAQHRIEMWTTDQYGDPIQANLHIDIVGVNPVWGQPAWTGTDGYGIFGYEGRNLGNDRVTFKGLATQAVADVEWVAPQDIPLAPIPAGLSATPLTETKDVNQYHDLNIFVTDQYGQPINNQTVLVTRTGAHPTSQPENAQWNWRGNYWHEYWGSVAGEDLIAIEVPTLSTPLRTVATATWRQPTTPSPLPSDAPIVGSGGLAASAGTDFPGQVIALSANMKQAYLDSSTRRLHFAERLKALKEKVQKDGMARAPDILLLQEIRRGQAVDVATRLNSHLPGTNYAVVIGYGDPYVADHGTYEIRSESAILINSNTMTSHGTGHIDHSYTKEDMCDHQKRVAWGAALDLDADGTSDCLKPKWKRTPFALLKEREADGQTFAVASVHFVLDNFIEDRDRAREYKAQWSADVANALRLAYPTADVYGIGGDFNQGRCYGDGVEPSVCDVTPFWARLSALGFVDEVYALHGESDAAIRVQYEDGWVTQNSTVKRWREKRIDYIFAAGRTSYSSASHDLTCGYLAPTGWPWNCTDLNHPHSYADHRLLWSYLGSRPRMTNS
ncbi:MAG TPA: endonuclease/exonuclease/phosphatase family protein [Actinomycetota bacterium]|nr:endonuclease/exonuclease/phosphatase family protein [Actinomycetota bacterium]